jgi:hypothetical protein
MVCVCIWCLSYCPGGIESSVEYIEAVDVSIVVIALEIFAVCLPGARGAGISVNVAISRSGSSNHSEN